MIFRPVQYRIDEAVAASLNREGVPPHIVQNAQKALNNSYRTFDRYLKRLKRRKLAWQIRLAAMVVDNTLLQEWRKNQCEDVLTMGFAWVRFRFPEETQFPCLPMRDPHYGLVYPLEGETIATASEIVLAIEAGAKVDAFASLELPMDLDGHGRPIRFFMSHLRDILMQRAEYKNDKDNPASKVLERLCKEFSNSFYGKTAQGVNPRNIVQADTGESVPLGPSKVTEPSVAALTTGLARAALSSFLLAIERFNSGRSLENQITVVSVTTDGLLVGLPTPEDYSVVGDYYTKPSVAECPEVDVPKLIGKQVASLAGVLDQFGCRDLLRILYEYMPIRQMRQSRKELTGDDTILEIKCLADEVISIKTRGQIGRLSTGHCSLIARFGQKPPLSEIITDREEYKRIMSSTGVVRNTADMEWLIEQIEGCDEEIVEYDFVTLKSISELLQSEGQADLTKKLTKRKFNADYDCKRRVAFTENSSGRKVVSPFTNPHKNLAQMKKFRSQMEALRKSGQTATPERILDELAIQDRATRFRGGKPVAITRLFIRGVVQGHILLKASMKSHAEMAQQLNRVWENLGLSDTDPKTWSKTDFKNASRGIWEPGLIRPSLSLSKLVDVLCVEFGSDSDAVKDLFFVTEERVTESVSLIEEVARAVIHAPRMSLDPFKTLYVDGYLPTRQGLIEAFHPHLSVQRLAQLEQEPFVPGKCSSQERSRIKRLLYRIGVTGDVAERCSRVIASIQPPKSHRQKTPRNQTCTESFVQALLQRDITPFKLSRAKILHHFGEYGLTEAHYRSLRQRKFQPKRLSNSTANRRQIQQMAKQMDVDPLPYLSALLNR
jgi:hypothetical protein